MGDFFGECYRACSGGYSEFRLQIRGHVGFSNIRSLFKKGFWGVV